MMDNISEHEQYNLENTDSLEKDWVSSPNISRNDKDINIKDFYIFNNQEAINKKGQKFGRTAFATLVKGSVFSVAATDYLIGITDLSYAPSVGLPRPKLVGAGKIYIVKDEAGGAATTTITIRSAGEETIDGASSSTITTNYQSKSYYSDGANWFTY